MTLNKILDGKKLAEKLQKEIKKELNCLKVIPKLAVLTVGKNPSIETYLNNKKKVFNKLGIDCEIHQFEEDVEEIKVSNLIDELNKSKKVHGILIELPLPPYLDKYKLFDLVNPLKDVDGLSSYNASRLMKGEEYFRPCTPQGIIKLLSSYEIPVINKKVVILGRSEIVGVPLQKIMLHEGANVIVCNSKTEGIEEKIKEAEILVSAIGRPHYVKKEMVSEGVIIIDVGINNFGGKIVGDVDFESVIEKAKYITPVPGGVGPMTVISLANNILKAYHYHSRNPLSDVK